MPKRIIKSLEAPKLSILIATIGQREQRFLKLIEELEPQVDYYKNQVEIVAYWNNGELPLATVRQKLVEAAEGDYLCFVDDDDALPDYYCDEILRVADGVDYIGWRMQLYHNGEPTKPTFHSLKYDSWSENEEGYYRNVSHLNPVKRQLAQSVNFVAERNIAEDVPWATQLAPLLKTENYINKIMYYYLHTTQDSTWRGKSELEAGREWIRPIIDKPWFRWHPDSYETYTPGVNHGNA